MPLKETITVDPQALVLGALAWTLGEDVRAQRFLTLTGIDPATLRAAAGAPATLDAVLGFLEGHQPDLVACAEALGVKPEQLVAAREMLGR